MGHQFLTYHVLALNTSNRLAVDAGGQLIVPIVILIVAHLG
jgi:hypothetical protein